MSLFQQGEAAALGALADAIASLNVQQVLAPVNLAVSSEAVTLADDEAAKLPELVRGFAVAAVEKYGSQLAPLLAKEEGYAQIDLVSFLRAAQAHVQ